MIDTQFPLLMETLHALVNQKRYHDAAELLYEARAYAARPPVDDDAHDLIAEAMAERWRAATGSLPDRRRLAQLLTDARYFPSATQPTIDRVLARLSA